MYLAIELGIGVVLALALIGGTRRLRLVELRVYGWFLIVTAAFYVVMALVRGAIGALPLELSGLVLFGLLGMLGLRGRPALLVIGWAGHALWDVAFHTGGRGAYVPEWYAMLCVGFDLLLAGYIVGRPWRAADAS